VEIGVPLFLSGIGVTIATVAFYNRENPEWQRSMRTIYGIAVAQVALGAMAWVVLNVL
jgi:hypothetical protein